MSNEGKKVSVHYTGTLDDGTKFDSSYDRNQPLEFTCMAGQMIKGFDEAVRDMEVGQTVNIHLEPSEAYGERREDLIYEFPMEQVPEDMRSLKVGEHVMLQGPMGQPLLPDSRCGRTGHPVRPHSCSYQDLRLGSCARCCGICPLSCGLGSICRFIRA